MRPFLQIAAQGTTDRPVLIQNMRVTTIETSPPLTGIAVGCTIQGFDAQLRGIAVNLDATPPTVDYKSDSNAPFGFTLAKGETESFVVSASAAKAAYRWRIEFDVVVNGVADTLEVGGKEGFTTTVKPAPYTAWQWNYYEDAWTHRNPSTNLVDKFPHRSRYQPPIKLQRRPSFAANLLGPTSAAECCVSSAKLLRKRSRGPKRSPTDSVLLALTSSLRL